MKYYLSTFPTVGLAMNDKTLKVNLECIQRMKYIEITKNEYDIIKKLNINMLNYSRVFENKSILEQMVGQDDFKEELNRLIAMIKEAAEQIINLRGE